MNIFLASDIHYECVRKRTAVPVPSAAEIVVLAGDVSYMPSALEIAGATARKTGLPVIFVPGNHEFYERQYEESLELANGYEHENVHVLINKSVILNGTKFIGTPLWTNFEAFGNQSANMMIAERHIYDFAAIRYGDKLLKAADMLKLHEEARRFLESELEKPFEGKTVVVTHFPPSYKLCHSRFQDSYVSPYFNAACDDLIDKYRPDAWFYGHTHAPVEREIHGVPMYCNMGGYPREDGVGFDPERIIKLPLSDCGKKFKAFDKLTTKASESGDAGELDMEEIKREARAQRGLIFYDSPFHVTHDKETADRMAAAVDANILKKRLQLMIDKIEVVGADDQFVNKSRKEAIAQAFLEYEEKYSDPAARPAAFSSDIEIEFYLRAIRQRENQMDYLSVTDYSAAINTYNNICTVFRIKTADKVALAVSDLPEKDSLETISRLVSIWRSLHMIFENEDQANTWIRRPNLAFDNKTALSVMIDEPDGLERVKKYLLAQLQ